MCFLDIVEALYSLDILNVFAWFIAILQHKVEYYGGIKIPGFHVNTSCLYPWCTQIIGSAHCHQVLTNQRPASGHVIRSQPIRGQCGAQADQSELQ